MTAPSRFLAWLVLPVLMPCAAATCWPIPLKARPEALHLLDYIGADYPVTVRGGEGHR